MEKNGNYFGVISILCAFLLIAAVESSAAEKTYTNSIGMEFILVPAGTFIMGADKNLQQAFDFETPQHRVTISKSFYLGKFPVTQAQWDAVVRHNRSKFKGPNNPVEGVSRDDIQNFIFRLSRMEGHKTFFMPIDPDRYRLPTEAEWEYAARAGTETAYSFGSDVRQLGDYAWYEDNSGGTTHPVGQKLPNPWGFYDMHGNVFEWVADSYTKDYYSKSPELDPTGPLEMGRGVSRGGAWSFPARSCRSAARLAQGMDHQRDFIGFRLAFTPNQ